MIASGLILTIASCLLAGEMILVRPVPSVASLIAGAITYAILVVSGNLLLGKGIREWRRRRHDAAFHRAFDHLDGGE